MSRLIRAVLIALAALIACAVITSYATASGTGAVSINTASTTAGSTNSILRINKRADGGQFTVTCATFNITTINISTPGAMTIPAGSTLFGTCQFGTIGVSISQPAAWSGIIRHLDTSAGSNVARSLTYDFTIPSGGISYVTPGCTFTIAGTLLADYVPATSIPHGTLVNVPGLNLPASLVTNSLTLSVERPTGIGCSSLRISNTDLVSFAGNFRFAGTGINGAPIAPN